MRIEDYSNLAQEILSGQVATAVPPTLQILCALTMALLKAKERSVRHAGWCETVARCLGKQTVPVSRGEFGVWLDQMTVLLAEGVRKKSTLDLRLKMFAACLKTALMFPSVFPELCDVVGSVSERVRAKRSMLSVGRLKLESRTAMTVEQVHSALGQCQSVEEKIFFVLCLATGLRAGEASRIRVQHLSHDGTLDLSKVQTKTETFRKPKAPIVVRAILKTFEPPWCEAKIEGFDRRRFRPTCATLLGLSGVPALRICERLGHANTTMVEKHYSKAPPSDMAGRDIEQYLDVGELSVSGNLVDENAFDRWCLLLAFTVVEGTLQAEKFKHAVETEMGTHRSVKPRARVF